MKITNLSFEKVNQFSDRDKAYQSNDQRLRNFYKYTPSIEAFPDVIKQKSNQEIDRGLLADTIRSTYGSMKISQKLDQNIALLREPNTFTITTAHQPSLLTGPLYYTFKICSVLNLCIQLNEKYPEYNFIPVFVSGGEDHDFEEINHFKLYNKTINWHLDHNSEPTGRLALDNFDAVFTEMDQSLRSESAARTILEKAIAFKASSKTYSVFVQELVNLLFGEFGLVFINMDQKAYKGSFKSFISKEILESKSKPLVVDQQTKLEEAGFPPQAHVREINFFYFTDDGQRRRVEKTGNDFNIVDTDLKFTESEMKSLINEQPERFSPNVVMRPIYQEYILPNLAYIGGGGELAYWLERKTQFEAFNIPYPMLIRRNSAMLVDHSSKKVLGKLGLKINDVFKSKNDLVNLFLNENSGDEFSLSNAETQIDKVFKEISEKFDELDKSLVPRVEAEKVKTLKTIAGLESRLKKVIKQRSENDLAKIEKLYGRLMPSNNLQERQRNILDYLDQYDLTLISDLIKVLDPMDKHFKIIDLTE